MSQSTGTLASLGDITIERFLSQYWQKKPLLVRSVFNPEQLSISGDDLAGLALEEDVESRLVSEHLGKWTLEHGPFAESKFAALPERQWTLLVQAVDHYIPEVQSLLNLFRFVPSWRLDDIMISYAVPGGSVGPHFDRYDVFLIQGQGQRHWQLGQTCDETTLRQEGPLNLVEEFTVAQEWTLNPGDMLYIPPGLAHHGVAVDHCITYSVGFRSPSVAEAFCSFADHLALHSSAEIRYRDTGVQAAPGEITHSELAHFAKWLTDQMQHTDTMTNWFGREMTRGKYADLSDVDLESEPAAPLDALLATDDLASKALDSRWAFIRSQNQAKLFVSGRQWSVSTDFAVAVCSQDNWEGHQLLALTETEDDKLALTELMALDLIVQSPLE